MTIQRGETEKASFPEMSSFLSLALRYNAAIWGPSGNVTINGSLTYSDSVPDPVGEEPKVKLPLPRQSVPILEDGRNLNTPPYAIHNG